ncbi:hypothetical protein [Paraburkholderia phenazinium]|jgi:hypothetical protein|uniref:Uncharacterized protein n=1 Tax=Paraburkholderia phenazinium TaxID=60549 RepID=A0A1G7TS50_9BURK|nr:hypothetical protein [Paraburkholderia phenazinium]SDG38067.1 hypothetical protein SAMN05216466_103139 [Paraburkholderia phenazinium]
MTGGNLDRVVEMGNATVNSGLSDTKRWLKELVEAGEAAVANAERFTADSGAAGEILELVTSQRDLVRGDVVKFRARLASLDPVKQVEKKFAVTFDHRYWKPGTFVYPIHVFLDPEHRFSAQQIQQIQALKVGEQIDLADGRVVQRQT